MTAGNEKHEQAMRVFVSVAVLAVLLCIMWCLWKLHPWMRPGQAVRIGSWRLGDCDVQVWQRKNEELLEPFATGLFVRRHGSSWQVFCLDHQDVYAPRISLKRDSAGVVVLRGNQRLGVFDDASGTYHRESDGSMFKGAVLQTEPPANWWLKP